MEGLFAHFFSAHRPAYHQHDVGWFLELANQQEHWCLKDVIQEVVGGTADQDLLVEYQKSIQQREKLRTSTLRVEVCRGRKRFLHVMCTFATDYFSLLSYVRTRMNVHCRFLRVPSVCVCSSCTCLAYWVSVTGKMRMQYSLDPWPSISTSRDSSLA